MPEHSQLIQTTLEQRFGFETLREGQLEVINQLVKGQSSLAIFPTGSGKSLCYQLSALLLPHLTLVVSPLLALMQDQIDFLAAKGIPAAKIDSTVTAEQKKRIVEDIKRGHTKILMVSVERFKNESFRGFISQVAISLLVVDEAHCISEWGHNFRPDYLKLPRYQTQLGNPEVLLLTATATRQVKLDMLSKFNIAPECVVQTGFYRANLDIVVESVDEPQKAQQALKWVNQLDGAGIVYVTLQQQADELARYLSRHGVAAQSYHAGLGDEKRQKIQRDFMHDEIRVVVATIAFGMGIDKSNIRFVLHYELPKSIESYSQEIGRAGRDGHNAKCICLANLGSVVTLENFIYGDTPDLESIVRLIELIAAQSDDTDVQSAKWETQLYHLSNHTNIKQLPLKTLLVQLELAGVIQPAYSYFAQFRLRFEIPASQILSKFSDERRGFLSDIFAACRIKKVWADLDTEQFETLQPNSRARLVAALDYLHEQGWIILESKQHTDVYQVNIDRLKEQNLAQRLFEYGQNKEQAEIERIADMLDFFQSSQCLSLKLSAYFDDVHSAHKCGHCSVCLTQAVKLNAPTPVAFPERQMLIGYLDSLRSTLNTKLSVKLNQTLACRFLAGISSPFLTRIRAKQLPGYASCESIRYAQIVAKVQDLL